MKMKRPDRAPIRDVFEQPPSPADLSTEEIYQLSSLLGRALGRISEVPLTRQQRGRFHSYLFGGHRVVADEVVHALRRDRDLFPEVRTDPDAMDRDFLCAGAWFCLAEAARTLAERATENYLMKEGSATWLALQILFHVRDGGKSSFSLHGPDLLARRAQSMQVAEKVLAHVRPDGKKGQNNDPKKASPKKE